LLDKGVSRLKNLISYSLKEGDNVFYRFFWEIEKSYRITYKILLYPERITNTTSITKARATYIILLLAIPIIPLILYLLGKISIVVDGDKISNFIANIILYLAYSAYLAYLITTILICCSNFKIQNRFHLSHLITYGVWKFIKYLIISYISFRLLVRTIVEISSLIEDDISVLNNIGLIKKFKSFLEWAGYNNWEHVKLLVQIMLCLAILISIIWIYDTVVITVVKILNPRKDFNNLKNFRGFSLISIICASYICLLVLSYVVHYDEPNNKFTLSFCIIFLLHCLNIVFIRYKMEKGLRRKLAVINV
jgi:hypothetical protein